VWETDIEEGERRMRRGGAKERNREGDEDMLNENGFEITVYRFPLPPVLPYYPLLTILLHYQWSLFMA
jgi:hypothetical protein